MSTTQIDPAALSARVAELLEDAATTSRVIEALAAVRAQLAVVRGDAR